MSYLMALAVLLPLVSAVTVRESCYNVTHKLETFEYVLTEDGTATTFNYTQLHKCETNCSSGECTGTYEEGDRMSMWMVYGVGMVLLIIGTFMGKLFNRVFSGESSPLKLLSIENGIKFVFFFAGLFLINLAMGMGRGIVTEYGGSTTVMQGMFTVNAIISWTMYIFLFVFLLELFFSVMASIKLRQEKEKWG